MDENTTNAGEMPEVTQEKQAVTEMVNGEPFDAARAMETIRKQREELKQYKTAALRLEALEAAEAKRKEDEMSDLQKAQARAAELEAQLNAVTRRQMQAEIAAKVGLPAALASRLQGETLEELEADAAAILETLPKPTKPAPGIVATNPGANGSAAETREQKKARLMGTPGDIWTGGGINYPQG